MSSKVITVPEANNKNNEEVHEADNDQGGGLGKQRNFYRHVSGAGDGHSLQTTADFGPNSPAHIVKPHLEDNEEEPHDTLVTFSPDPEPQSEEVKNEVRIESDWQKKIRSLQDQILAVLLNVDKDKVDVTIGRTSIQRDKAVVLAWNKSQQNMVPVAEDQNFTASARPDIIADELHEEEQPEKPVEDGVLLFLAIKVKEEFKDQQEDHMRRLFRNDFNNNPGTIQKKVKKSVFKKVVNALGVMEEIEVQVNKRKVTRNVIDEKSGRVMEVETEVTTEDSEEDVVNADGSIGKKTKKKTRRGRTGGQRKHSRRRLTSQGEEAPKRVVVRKKSRQRKLTPAEIQKGIATGTIKKSDLNANGDYFKEEEYFEEEVVDDTEGSDYSYDSEEDYSGEEYDDDAEVIDVSGRGHSRSRKFGEMRRRRGGKRMSRMEQARFQRRFCGHGKPGTIPEEGAKYGRRAKSLDGEYEDEDDDDFFFENEFSNVNYWRHEYCYDEFQGYGAEYSGPIGILTSFLPDGTSVLKNKPEKSRDDPDHDTSSERSKSKKTSLERRLSKVSTIPEEDNEQEDASNANENREECCTPTDGRHLSRAVQVPNRIRRLRTRHIQPPKNLWFTGSVDKSFNSRCSKRFETKDLEEDAVHYYYYRSLPKINALSDSYTPSITSSVENIEPPKLPKVIRRPEDLLL